MTVLQEIPFSPSFEEYGKKIKIEKYASMEDTVRKLFDDAAAKIQPKAIVKECYIDEKDGNEIQVDSIRFASTMFPSALDSAQRIFAYVATCGNELEIYSRDPSDFMEQFLVDELKEMALRYALDYLRTFVMDTYKLKKVATMNPGSADVHVWPIEQQQDLFRLLGKVEKSIGVILTDSHLMIPNKSVSGIYFSTEANIEMCQECRREECPSRRAAFKGK